MFLLIGGRPWSRCQGLRALGHGSFGSIFGLLHLHARWPHRCGHNLPHVRCVEPHNIGGNLGQKMPWSCPNFCLWPVFDAIILRHHNISPIYILKWRQYWQFVPACTVLELIRHIPKILSVLRSLRKVSQMWWVASSFHRFLVIHSPLVSHIVSINELIWSDRRQLRSRYVYFWRNDSTLWE